MIHTGKIPTHYNDGKDQHHRNDMKLLYQQHYCDTYDYGIISIKVTVMQVI